MSLRRVVEDLLGADGSGTEGIAPGDERAGAALEAAGHGDLEPDLYGEALVHFADTAPLAQADALSPIVTEASAVPIDPELDPPMPIDAVIDDLDPAVDGTDDPEPGDDDPDVLDSGAVEPDDRTVEEATELDGGVDADTSGSVDSFGSGASDERSDDGREREATADLDEATSLTAPPGEPDLTATPDPLDPATPDESDGAGLVEDFELVDEPADIDPDLLLDD